MRNTLTHPKVKPPTTTATNMDTRGTPTPKRTFDSDIADYSFDRAVICDRARTADLLIANNFHFENNCAVLSVDGYPPHAFETTNDEQPIAFIRRTGNVTSCGE